MHECNTNVMRSSCKEESLKKFYGHETEKMADDLMELICPSNLRWGTADCTQVAGKLPQVDIGEDENPSILPLIIDLMKRLAD
jgi:hypothetical protein